MTRVRTVRQQNAFVHVMQVLFGAGILGLWELLTVTHTINLIAMPEPWHVAEYIGVWFRDGMIWSLLGQTLSVAAIGLVIGLAGGAALGFLTGTVRWFAYFFNPVLSFMNAIPQLIILPILIVWLGFGDSAQIVIVVIVNLFLVAIVIQAAIREINGVLVSNVRALGASWRQRFTSLYIPGTLVWLISVTRLCVGHAIVAACVAEFFGSPRGLGYAIYYGLETFNTREVYSALIVTSVVAYLIDIVLRHVDMRIGRYLPAR